ncbi:LOW QUALITY PROTEIN: RING finger protein 208 [Tachyglossus aculeatus]|uniref:LOW QUALITY PROTEIN: RING finger protein 208 n=1 Tax=Tachyglossus aculeatus TaxID=9261 RepID=UPI0018F44D11|nr:LOW QUALITY PROTEIN: RING finger protein 208 [Tachyglossus aculeatus]
MPAEGGGGGLPGLLMSCLKGQQVLLKMEAMKIVHPEKCPELQGGPAPRFAPAPAPPPALAPKRAWPSDAEAAVSRARGGDGPAPAPGGTGRGGGGAAAEPGDEVIVNQYVLRAGPPGEPLECPTCGHTYNLTHRRPRVLSCLHSVCEQCLQILYESCPKYKFISCPTCRRETVLFTDYGLAALAVNTSILGRLPPEALAASAPGQWVGEAERGCYQTFRRYCGAACTCHARNPLSSCAIM